MQIIVTLVIALTFVASAVVFFVNFAGPPEVASQAMLVAFCSGAAQLIWLLILAIAPSTSGFRSSVRANLKHTFWSLLLCIPGAFLIIGMLAAPIIVIVSSIRLMAAMWKDRQLKYES